MDSKRAHRMWGKTLSIALLAGLWQAAAVFARTTDLAAWLPLERIGILGSLGWSVFFFIGGQKSDLLRGAALTYVGALWGIIASLIWGLFAVEGWSYYLGAFLSIAVAGGGIVLTSHINYLRTISGMFIGSSALVIAGSGTLSWPVILVTVLGLAIGLLLGWLSDLFARALDALFYKKDKKKVA